MMRTVPIMLDVDTGVDDASALALAAGLRANLVGVSTVAGNVNVDLATDNTLRILAALGLEGVPVFRGASRPLAVPYENAALVHGENGLGNATLPASPVSEAEMSGPDAIIAMAEQYDGELVLVMVGPVTNLAIAMSLRPGIVRQISKVVVMGGAYFTGGNVRPWAEYNVMTDPDAANQVFAANWNEIVAIGLDVTHQVVITEKMWDRIPADAEGAAGLLRAISRRTFETRVRSAFFLHDPLALGVALDPSLIGGDRYAVTVSTDPASIGRTDVSEGGNVLVATSVDVDRFQRRFCAAIGIPYLDESAELNNAE
ncbi:MAG TPA: nucleoside hydrolase [Thermomicrobiales bacterium]|nr:nucleoside hydrolase [Thermomicrobiales bacterium]